ncbi:hypothetical protein DB31_0872 [Hyalangium minutum]|uniref:Uncharacterized protein n=1 Tax=Hyalangium minutum TaxID=394096 RepID=A0A085WFD6_9BACT|nr:hypothetical protein DB31_0872 [Hyalangium minutum]
MNGFNGMIRITNTTAHVCQGMSPFTSGAASPVCRGSP